MTESNDLLTLYSDIQTVPVNWLWYPYIAVGKITLLQGDPGDGKSTMMLNLIAEMSKGGAAPDGRAFGRPLRVIYQCSEDGVGDTIKPRLEASGADCRNVAFINEEVHSGLTLDDERLRQAIISFRAKLIVIDPIQAYIGNDSDLQIAARARKLMRRLSMWASTYNCAVVLIGHMNKREGSKELYRSLGSIDVIASARSVLQVERNEDVRVVKQIKNSLAPTGPDIKFEINSNTGFKWLSEEEPEDRNLEQLSPEPYYPRSKHELAAILIKKVLSKSDATAKEIQELLRSHGIGNKTMQQTKQELGITSHRKDRKWFWHMERMEETE